MSNLLQLFNLGIQELGENTRCMSGVGLFHLHCFSLFWVSCFKQWIPDCFKPLLVGSNGICICWYIHTRKEVAANKAALTEDSVRGLLSPYKGTHISAVFYKTLLSDWRIDNHSSMKAYFLNISSRRPSRFDPMTLYVAL
jgi:hypothetical protein